MLDGEHQIEVVDSENRSPLLMALEMLGRHRRKAKETPEQRRMIGDAG